MVLIRPWLIATSDKQKHRNIIQYAVLSSFILMNPKKVCMKILCWLRE